HVCFGPKADIAGLIWPGIWLDWSLPGLKRAELIPDLVHQSIDAFFGRQLVRRLGHSPVEAQPPKLFVVRRDDEDLLASQDERDLFPVRARFPGFESPSLGEALQPFQESARGRAWHGDLQGSRGTGLVRLDIELAGRYPLRRSRRRAHEWLATGIGNRGACLPGQEPPASQDGGAVFERQIVVTGAEGRGLENVFAGIEFSENFHAIDPFLRRRELVVRAAASIAAKHIELLVGAQAGEVGETVRHTKKSGDCRYVPNLIIAETVLA